ncbi:hypothetical protein KW800_02185 [Candidatus Parcubacteria bacterium]|nr:hypothetical protein [Candidatus Parcubacteria bacterium]
MEAEERARLEKKLDELCEKVDRKVENFINNDLHPIDDADFIKMIRKEMERVRAARLEAQIHLRRGLLGLVKEGIDPNPQITKTLQESKFAIYRSMLTIQHTTLLTLIQEWRIKHDSSRADEE